MKLLGIDPDLNGGIALVQHPERAILSARFMPIRGKKPPLNEPLRVDAESLYLLIIEYRRLGAQYVVLERAVVRAQVGAKGKPAMQAGVDRTHQNFGAIRAICELAFTPSRVILAAPSVWKRAMGLDSDKAKSRHKAAELYPSHTQVFSAAKSAGLAEAVLLTEWGLSQV